MINEILQWIIIAYIVQNNLKLKKSIRVLLDKIDDIIKLNEKIAFQLN